MTLKSNIKSIPSNSPVSSIPSDYFPPECGFWYELSDGIDADKKLFFRDSNHGEGTPEATIVFVHGNPESSYTYRTVIEHLIKSAKKSFRIVAMDHIGFGLSDQASFEMVSMDHANNLFQLIEYLDLKRVTLVIHDWGGPIGIGAFLKAPDRVANLVILNSTVFPFPKTGMTYENYPLIQFPWANTPNIIPNNLWGAFASFAIFYNPEDPQELISALPNMLAVARDSGSFSENETIAQKFFRTQFQSEMNVMSSKRLVLQTPLWGHGNIYKEPLHGERDTTSFYRFIQDNITKCWGPNGQNIGVQAVLGKWDPSAKDEVMQQWIENLPQLECNVKIFEDAGHFIEEIKPEAIASAISTVANLL
ncbi:MAG: alpha/beta fold hydrolase [Promethearchaeota archaeon]|jgi:pimeloyl-ACP methyl ester carboxylesterase